MEEGQGAEGGSGAGGAGDEPVMGGFDEVAEVVVAHGVDGDGSGGESCEAEEDDVDADGPEETETPEIETHHKRQKARHEYDIRPAYDLSDVLLYVLGGKVVGIRGEDLVGMDAPMRLRLAACQRG